MQGLACPGQTASWGRSPSPSSLRPLAASSCTSPTQRPALRGRMSCSRPACSPRETSPSARRWRPSLPGGHNGARRPAVAPSPCSRPSRSRDTCCIHVNVRARRLAGETSWGSCAITRMETSGCSSRRRCGARPWRGSCWGGSPPPCRSRPCSTAAPCSLQTPQGSAAAGRPLASKELCPPPTRNVKSHPSSTGNLVLPPRVFPVWAEAEMHRLSPCPPGCTAQAAWLHGGGFPGSRRAYARWYGVTSAAKPARPVASSRVGRGRV